MPIASGCDEAGAFDEIVARLDTRIPPTFVDDAPAHENLILGDDIDLSILPVPRYSPDDTGPDGTQPPVREESSEGAAHGTQEFSCAPSSVST